MQFGDLFDYKPIEKQEGLIRYQVRINPKHKIFEGHFPGLPILPGVMQVELIKEVLSLAFKQEFQLQTARDIKFLAMLNPEEVNQVECTIDFTKQEDNSLKVNAVLANGDTNYLKLRGVFCGKAEE